MDKLKAMWRILISKGFVVFTVHQSEYKCMVKLRNYDAKAMCLFGYNELRTIEKEN